MLHYRSTRGQAPELTYPDVMTAGLAGDGGLYVPTSWPQWHDGSDRSYAEVVAQVVSTFTEPDLDHDELVEIAVETYGGFGHPEVAPLRQLADGLYVLELFWGPTLAFKDFALQLLGRLTERTLARERRHMTVLGATSGDTGSAAIAGFSGLEHVDVVILHPEGRVSEVQRRQMTTVTAGNVHNLAIAGTFDDCQALVKQAFLNEELRSALSLGSVNSINWMRVAAQVAYYVWLAAMVGPADVVVPSGNFGNLFSGHVARHGGTPINRLVAASNRNHILATFIETGRLEVGDVRPTLSPSMDIQVPSNLERLLLELYENDSERLTTAMEDFSATGSLVLSADEHARLGAAVSGGWVDDSVTLGQMAETYERYGFTADPHTAVAFAVADQKKTPPNPQVVLATAHPAKFPDAVEQATGIRPALPSHLSDLYELPEVYETLLMGEVQDWLLTNLR